MDLSMEVREVASKKRRAGRKKFQETRHPIYKGVRRRNGKWVCEMRHPHDKSRVWLGTYFCPDMAARAHDVAALALRGHSASLNFPHSAHLLPQPASSSIKDIQAAALDAATAVDESVNVVEAGNIVVEYSSPPSSCSYSTSEEGREEIGDGSGQVTTSTFLDEEELFNMPALLDGMAEGLILTPPSMKRGFNWDDSEGAVDLTLWSD